MRKTLAAANRGERVPFKIPRSVQQSIPIQRVWQDGIWQVNGRFSQTWRFADINYSLASYEDQRDMSPTRRPVTACSVSAALLSRLPTSFPGPGPCINCGTPLPQTSEAMSKLPSN